MAKTYNRRVTSYPLEGTYNKLILLAEKQDRSISSVVKDAISSYVNKENHVK